MRWIYKLHVEHLSNNKSNNNHNFFIDNSFIDKPFTNNDSFNEKSFDNEESLNNEESFNTEKKHKSNNKLLNKPKFDIWSLYDLQTSFIREVQLYQLHSSLEQEIIDWQRQKIKILRYNLDDFYNYQIVTVNNYIMIHHLWHGELFDVDQYDLNTNHIIYKNTIEYTLGNVFDMVINKVINKQYDLNNNLIMSIIVNTYPFARFNYNYFKYLYNNCKYENFKNQVGSRILLYNLSNKEKNK